MTAYGNAELVVLPTLKIVTTVAPPIFGSNYGIADFIFDVDPRLPIVDPIVGQIWPRGMVGPYTGATRGIYYVLSLVRFVPRVPDVIGQLWPRGDYIPSEND